MIFRFWGYLGINCHGWWELSIGLREDFIVAKDAKKLGLQKKNLRGWRGGRGDPFKVLRSPFSISPSISSSFILFRILEKKVKVYCVLYTYECWMMAVSLFGQSAVEVDELSYSLACIADTELKGSVILSQKV